MGVLDQVRELASKYGAAFVFVTQLLGWITYFMIYAVLAYSGLDVAAVLRQWNMSESMVSLADTGGLAALAFALNRLLMPLRLAIAVAMMPSTAPPLNRMLEPLVKALGFGGAAPAVAAAAAPKAAAPAPAGKATGVSPATGAGGVTQRKAAAAADPSATPAVWFTDE